MEYFLDHFFLEIYTAVHTLQVLLEFLETEEKNRL
jgi:hypothetical protein